MFERFTDRARRATVLAQEEARSLNHNYIGTEHILLGLLIEGEGVAFKALDGSGIDAEQARAAVLAKIGPGAEPQKGQIPFTPRARKVMELALREALQLGHNYIGTEHLLLALARETEGVGAQVLVEMGAELAQVRKLVIQIITGYQASVDRDQQSWLKKAKPITVYVLACSYCRKNVTGETGYPRPEDAVAAAKAAGAMLTTLGGLTFDGPPVACAECQKRPISEFRSEVS